MDIKASPKNLDRIFQTILQLEEEDRKAFCRVFNRMLETLPFNSRQGDKIIEAISEKK